MKVFQVAVWVLAVGLVSFSGHVSGQVKLSYPPWKRSDLNCSYDDSAMVTDPALICTPKSDGKAIIFSYDNDVLAVRYAYTKPVRLYRKGTRYATSFATSFVVDIRRDIERSVRRVFGGSWAFAITPDQLTRNAGPESIGLFPIDINTGKPLPGPSPRTVAVEIDTSREQNNWDFPVLPHLGIDVNSLKSVKVDYLWNQTAFVRRKVGYFVDYDAKTEVMQVRVQNITSNGKLNKRNSKLWLTYPKFKLSDHVNEYSIVGFSSRVPVTDDGTYDLYAWNFETKEVLTNKMH
ncbi:hypothetical protein MPTK1_3g01320 [Marchantia polymorpha subsp. ruderalis]|uniref:Legume lectin domain-containing protein n=2 Tax=Marchantia polymorpha TaxID=3197 RepID=A0AAF6AW99_MARPO|nr:hypothetical protein MARPO_0007s0126 [Marchantia polymorpha]BBN04033.1 hypothetical protein Mp_3g01320 [Marchantia polymorpha subsp. ruderalis]|eukprot:PTQ47720.1 hypothetical protein MARPO_0007s0126 [Marchantia polymorpha]